MRRTLTCLALLSALAGPAFADDSRVVQSVKLQDLQTLLTEEGYTIGTSGGDGADSVTATDTAGSGLVFHLIGTGCETDFADGCLGISMQVRYDADGKETLQRINDVNLSWAATSAWYAAGGADGGSPTVGISRYVILDGGISMLNIKANLVNLLAIAPQAADYIWQVGEYAPDAEFDDYYDEDDGG